ncbi:MAG: hypothetical protein JW798_03480 [Prolixibacteraceae bacterium]|nr:hypothetical protein [Prolixibacteraceae bacterium]
MKKIVLSLISILFILFFTNNLSYADSTPIVILPHTFGSASPIGAIDIDQDGTGDFIIEYVNDSWGFYFELVHVGTFNEFLAEYVPPIAPAASTEGTPPLSLIFSLYASILPYGTEIEKITSPASPAMLERMPSGPNWANYAHIIYRYTGAPTAPLTTTAQQGAYDGYIGVNFQASTGWHNGWLHVLIDEITPSVTVLSAGMGSAPGDPVYAGAGDPYASAVPIPLIASILGMVAIGSGVIIQKRRKK